MYEYFISTNVISPVKFLELFAKPGLLNSHYNEMCLLQTSVEFFCIWLLNVISCSKVFISEIPSAKNLFYHNFNLSIILSLIFNLYLYFANPSMFNFTVSSFLYSSTGCVIKKGRIQKKGHKIAIIEVWNWKSLEIR